MLDTDQMASHHLTHFNLAWAKAPLDHPTMAGFVSQLEHVNGLAKASPGFIWTVDGDEAGNMVDVFGSALALANMSGWASLEDLRRFVYEGAHGQSVARRREWFEMPTAPA